MDKLTDFIDALDSFSKLACFIVIGIVTALSLFIFCVLPLLLAIVFSNAWFCLLYIITLGICIGFGLWAEFDC